MTEIMKLDSEALLSRTRELVRRERQITLALIEHLREIERRMLFADMGFGSLFEFAVKHLGLSEGSAHRRIATMRLLRDTPEAKEAVESGRLSLSNAAQLQVVIRAERRETGQVSPERKIEIISAVSNLTQRQCEKKLLELVPAAFPVLQGERQRRLSDGSVEIRVSVKESTNELLTELRELLASRLPDHSIGGLIDYLAEKEIDRIEKEFGYKADQNLSFHPVPGQSEKFSSTKTYVSRRLKKLVLGRAGRRCEYPGCTSRYRLEVDHIVPKSQGGTNRPENLRLLCRTHNVFEARRLIGARRMGEYIPTIR